MAIRRRLTLQNVSAAIAIPKASKPNAGRVPKAGIGS